MVDAVRLLEGQRVNVSLGDLTRIDDAMVVGVIADAFVCLHTNGEDVIVDLLDVVDLWAR
jgi:hypothetical protein